MNNLPVLWAIAGVAFTAFCLFAYVRGRVGKLGWFEWDAVVMAAMAVWFAVLVALDPSWDW